MENSVKALPCPFCGSEAYNAKQYLCGDLVEWTQCSNKECGASAMPEAWNRRFFPAESKVLRVLVKALQPLRVDLGDGDIEKASMLTIEQEFPPEMAGRKVIVEIRLEDE